MGKTHHERIKIPTQFMRHEQIGGWKILFISSVPSRFDPVLATLSDRGKTIQASFAECCDLYHRLKEDTWDAVFLDGDDSSADCSEIRSLLSKEEHHFPHFELRDRADEEDYERAYANGFADLFTYSDLRRLEPALSKMFADPDKSRNDSALATNSVPSFPAPLSGDLETLDVREVLHQHALCATIDPNDRLRDVNPFWSETTSTSRSALIGKSVFTFVDDPKGEFRTKVQAARQLAKPVYGETTIHLSPFQSMEVLFSLWLEDPKSKDASLKAMFTPSFNKDAKGVVQQPVVKAMLESPLGVVLADFEGGISFMNESARRMLFGEQERELLEDSKLPDALLKSGMEADERTILEELREGSNWFSGDLCLESGEAGLWVNASISPVVGSNRFNSGVLITLRDVDSERSNAIREFETERQQAIERIARGVEAELGPSLAALLAYAQLCGRNLSNVSKSLSRLETIEDEAFKALASIQRLVAYCGDVVAVREPVKVTDLVEELVTSMCDNDELQTEFLVDSTESLPVGVADLEHAKLVIAAWVDNALSRSSTTIEFHIRAEFVNEARTLHVGKLEPGNYICVEIQDDGDVERELGILNRLEPYAPNVVDANLLTVARGLAIANGMGVSLKTYEERGMEVRCYIPVARRSISATTKKEHAHSLRDMSQQTVLLVDYRESVQKACKSLLERRGLRVVCANTLNEGLERIEDRAEKIDLLVTDLVLPKGSGLELVEALRRQSKEIPVLMYASYLDGEVLSAAYAAGATHVLQTPINPEEFSTTVGTILSVRSKSVSGAQGKGLREYRA